MNEGFHTASCDGNVTIFWQGPTVFDRGTASADRTSEHVWWINRVLVQPEECRGKGIGTVLVQLLKENLKGQGTLTVCPGGYSDDVERQKNFYLKCGFVDNGDLLVCTP